MRARDGTDLAVRMLAAGLVLGPRAVPDAIGEGPRMTASCPFPCMYLASAFVRTSLTSSQGRP